MEGGRTQQSAMAGASSALSSMSRRSFGRSYTQTLSSLSTARPVTPPIFHLFGIVFGQSGSNLYLGAAGVCATTGIARVVTAAHRPANAANVHALLIAVSSSCVGNDTRSRVSWACAII